MASSQNQLLQNYFGGRSRPWNESWSPSLASALRKVFNLARTQMAQDFLFFPNPTVDAAILTSPSRLHYTVAGQIFTEFFPETGPGPFMNKDQLDDQLYEQQGANHDKLFSHWLLIPAFVLGSQSACYFVQKSENPVEKDGNGAVRSALYRIITDDTTGELLYVGDNPEVNMIQILHNAHHDAASHERIVISLDRNLFFKIMKENVGGEIPYDKLCFAVTMFIETLEKRYCPLCHAPPSSMCGCRPNLIQASSLYDLRPLAHNIQYHTGSFRGKQKMFLVYNGKIIKKIDQLTRHQSDSNAEYRTVAELKDWAVRYRLNSVRESPHFPPTALATDKSGATAVEMGDEFKSIVDILMGGETHETTERSHDHASSTRTTMGAYRDTVSGDASSYSTSNCYQTSGSQDECTGSVDISQVAARPVDISYSQVRLLESANRMHSNAQAIVVGNSHNPWNGTEASSPVDSQAEEVRNGLARVSCGAYELPPRSPDGYISAMTPPGTECVPMMGDTAQATTRRAQCASNVEDSLEQVIDVSSSYSAGTRSSGNPSYPTPIVLAKRVRVYGEEQRSQCTPNPEVNVPNNGSNAKSHAINSPPTVMDVSAISACPQPKGFMSQAGLAGATLANGEVGASGLAPSIARGGGRAPTGERRLLPRGNQPPPPPGTEAMPRELEMRIRKREAAMRSDKRRAQRVNELKEKTSELKEKESELRKRLANLKKENHFLRREVEEMSG